MQKSGDHGQSPEIVAGVLGGVEVRLSGAPVPLGHARQRAVLAVLLMEGNQAVSVDGLIQRVWDKRAPSRVRSALRTYLSNLRRALAPTPFTITRQDTGYLLTVDPDTVDVHRFGRLHALARHSGDPAHALALVEEGLALWRGEPLAEVDTPWARAARERLHLERSAAEADRIDWALECGRHRDLIPLVTARAAEHPLDERVAGQLMLALARDGRRADALEHYRHVRARLVEELGVDPGADLQELQLRILASEPTPTAARTAAGPPVPRQLPAPPAPFVGRQGELDRLDTVLNARNGATVLISAIGGAGGIGKTWLALHWAHAHRDRFPDGQLFADLRGFSPAGEPTAPAVVVRGFLDALGVDSDRIPTDLDAQAAMLRSLLAGKRMLLVLDNAVDTAQITPLLPGSESCVVVVTSRNRLSGLITAHGAQHVSLSVLPDVEARALLTGRLGADRVDAEAAAVADLIGLCGGFPLALSIVAARAHSRAGLPLEVLAGELRDLGLDALDGDDPAASLPTVLSWSLRGLTAEQREVFALLGIAPGPDTALPAATSLTGLSPTRTHRALHALEEASLLNRDARGRYAMHDLVRDYATTIAARDLTEPARRAALDRVVDFYLHTAHIADRLLDPYRRPIELDPPVTGAHPQPLADIPAALTWLAAEHAHLLAAQDTAVAHHRHHVVWQLAWTLYTFHYRRGHHHDNLALWRVAADAADRLADPSPRALVHRHFGIAHVQLGLHEKATEHLHHALTLAERDDDLIEQANAHRQFAWVREQQGDDGQALKHAERALDLYRALGQPVGEVRALTQVGWYAGRLGDYEMARVHGQTALALNRQHYSAASEADILHTLGWIDQRTGRHRQAIDRYRQAIALFHTVGDTVSPAGALDQIGLAHAALGEDTEAREAWQEAVRLYREQGRDADADRVQRQLDDLDNTVDDRDRTS